MMGHGSHVIGHKLGILASQFPRYDEVFILRELTALAQDHADIVIFSLRLCRDRVIHEQAKRFLTRTVYAPFLWSWAVWRSNWSFLRRASKAYGAALWWVLSRNWRHPTVMLKTLVLFPKTVHFAKLALEAGVTHLHAFWATYPTSSVIVMSRLTGIPFSLSAHAHDIYTVNPALPEKMEKAKFVVTCTEDNKQYLEKVLTRQHANGQTGKQIPIHVSYHGVDLERFAPMPKPNGGICQILAVGSLRPCKGFESLIETCRQLKQEQFPFRCVIAGGGLLERKLRQKIRQSGLEQELELTGAISQEEVSSFYRQAHLFVLPLISRIHWGIPNVLIEALATKTPVITCALPSLGELIEHGKTGWVIQEQDPGQLVQVIRNLWADSELRQQMAEAGYNRVMEKFSLEVTGRRLRELFGKGVSAF